MPGQIRKNAGLSRWVLFGLLGIPPSVFLYFYLVLHVGFGLPARDLLFPALIFCAFVPAFSAGAYWGTRLRARGNSGVLFVVLGSFVLLCGIEFSYFEIKLGFSPKRHLSTYGFTVVWAIVIALGAYFLDIRISAGRSRSRQG